jgi:geranylgeranyl pyrophosphate synthase
LKRSSPEDRKILVEIAKETNRGDDELSTVVKLIEKYDGINYAIEQARNYSQRAVDSLGIFEDIEKKKPLVDLAEYVVRRVS